jgi:hypothetical protein
VNSHLDSVQVNVNCVLGIFGIPTAVVLGGGYAKNTQDTVDIHLHTIKVAIHSMMRR